jgi:hypothetical protein
MHLLRIITPEEISEIATKHNGGKFLSLTDLAVERFEKKIYRDFSEAEAEKVNDNNEAEVEESEAKILPFTISSDSIEEEATPVIPNKRVHSDSENMATFILIEKERLKKSQQSLKQKEIIDLYRKNSHVDVAQIKQTNQEAASADEVGILINKKHY